MKINIVLLFVVIPFALSVGCAKNSADNARPNNNQNGDQNGNNSGNTPAAKDSGLVVIYTNTRMTDSIEVTVNDVAKGRLSPWFGFPNGTPKYGSKLALSLKMPVGNITVNGMSTHKTARTTSATIVKNDTAFVLLDYRYEDANKDDYYLQYTQELYTNQSAGVSSDVNIKLDPVANRWMFSNIPPQIMNVVSCAAPNPGLFYDGISITSPLVQVPPTDKYIKWRRISYSDLPTIGSYSNVDGIDYDTIIKGQNNGNCSVIINDFEMGCGLAESAIGSGAQIEITNVKIIEDLGLEKRGYYEGTLKAALIKNSFSTPNVQLWAVGKFKAPIGGLK